MSSQEISGYYNLMPDEVSFTDEDEVAGRVDTAMQNAKPRAESNPTVQQREESTGSGSTLRPGSVAGTGLNVSPKEGILKKSFAESNSVAGERESSLDQDGELITASKKSRVSFNGKSSLRGRVFSYIANTNSLWLQSRQEVPYKIMYF